MELCGIERRKERGLTICRQRGCCWSTGYSATAVNLIHVFRLITPLVLLLLLLSSVFFSDRQLCAVLPIYIFLLLLLRARYVYYRHVVTRYSRPPYFTVTRWWREIGSYLCSLLLLVSYIKKAVLLQSTLVHHRQLARDSRAGNAIAPVATCVISRRPKTSRRFFFCRSEHESPNLRRRRMHI